MGSHVWVGADGRAVGDVVSWADPCDAAERAELLERAGPERLYAITGQRVPGLAARHLWGRTAGRVGVPVPLRQWLVEVATGVRVIDPTDASVTGCLDLEAGTWSRELAGLLGVPDSALPPVRACDAVAGEVTAAGSVALGLPEGVPVLVGAGDGPCASAGAGALDPGVACLTLGSGATLRLITPAPAPDPGRRSTVLAFAPGRYVLSIPVGNAGFAIQWACRALGFADGRELAAAAARGRTDPGLIALPYVTGERFPYWDPSPHARIHGIQARHDRCDLARAVLLGIGCTLLRALRHAHALGHRPRTVVVNGGAAATGTLPAMIAALFALGSDGPSSDRPSSDRPSSDRPSCDRASCDGPELRVCQEEATTGAALLAHAGLERAGLAGPGAGGPGAGGAGAGRPGVDGAGADGAGSGGPVGVAVRPEPRLIAEPALLEDLYGAFIARSDRAFGAAVG